MHFLKKDLFKFRQIWRGLLSEALAKESLGSSVVEQRTENPCVVSSILTRGTPKNSHFDLHLSLDQPQ